MMSAERDGTLNVRANRNTRSRHFRDGNITHKIVVPRIITGAKIAIALIEPETEME
jgi:hypothetical protein